VIRVLALIVLSTLKKVMSTFTKQWKRVVWMMWTVLFSLVLAATRLLLELVLFAAAPGRAYPLQTLVDHEALGDHYSLWRHLNLLTSKGVSL
jgi:hypothetical protein